MQPCEQYSLGFSFALKNVKSGVWNWNIKDSTVFFSPNYFRISGYPPDAFPHSYEGWKQRVHPEDIAPIEKMMHQFLPANQNSMQQNTDLRQTTLVGCG